MNDNIKISSCGKIKIIKYFSRIPYHRAKEILAALTGHQSRLHHGPPQECTQFSLFFLY